MGQNQDDLSMSSSENNSLTKKSSRRVKTVTEKRFFRKGASGKREKGAIGGLKRGSRSGNDTILGFYKSPEHHSMWRKLRGTTPRESKKNLSLVSLSRQKGGGVPGSQNFPLDREQDIYGAEDRVKWSAEKYRRSGVGKV